MAPLHVLEAERRAWATIMNTLEDHPGCRAPGWQGPRQAGALCRCCPRAPAGKGPQHARPSDTLCSGRHARRGATSPGAPQPWEYRQFLQAADPFFPSSSPKSLSPLCHCFAQIPGLQTSGPLPVTDKAIPSLPRLRSRNPNLRGHSPHSMSGVCRAL